ncbi:hypothetical protein D3C72_356120 [compost metagenome]
MDRSSRFSLQLAAALVLWVPQSTDARAEQPIKPSPAWTQEEAKMHFQDPRWLLHTKARRYCFERFDYWVACYGRMKQARPRDYRYGYSDEAVNIFPRYNLMIALSRDIERYRPTDFSSVDSLRAALISSGTNAMDFMIDMSKRMYPPDATPEELASFRRQEQLEAEAVEDERRIFKEFVRSLSVADCKGVAPLPDRRTLSSTETQQADKYLQDVWGVEVPYWHPLTSDKLPPSVLSLQSGWFCHDVPLETVLSILRSHGVKVVWKCNHVNNHQYEIPLDDMTQGIGWGGEGYLFSPAQPDWLIYFSHESSITFGGSWLVEAIKSQYPDWQKRVWTTWDYELPD